jgi:hypothetical protein
MLMFFRRRSPVEKVLEAHYAQLAQGPPLFLNPRHAGRLARDVVREGRRRGEDEGLPHPFGDFILARRAFDPKASDMLEARRQEGVREADFLWWWNMHPIERNTMLAFDDVVRVNLWSLIQRQQGLPEAAATTALRRRVVNYGNPGGTSTEHGDDRSLPFELKDRVNRWFETQDQAQFEHKLLQFSSLNALIRHEIRTGRL